MMLDHLGHPEAAQAVVDGDRAFLAAGKGLTADLGGRATTAEVGKAIAAML